MLIKKYFEEDVVTAAKNRIKSLFNSGVEVILSFSGGKDSIVLADITYKLILRGEINPKQLEVIFIDEEAMYEDCIDIVKLWRRRFIEAGVQFNWYCIPVKHFNCLNTLGDEETFICWDPNKKDKWIREMPPFAITDHPLLIPEKDNYQSFFTRLLAHSGKVCMMGVRNSESIQRLKNSSVTKGFMSENKCKPIYDMLDKDVWLYIYKNNLEYPIAYENLYRIGTPTNHLRISQFFSIDTAKSLVSLSEMYPSLMERVIKREPNAYLCAMYWDTEMFGKTTRKRKQLEDLDATDYKSKVFELLRNPEKLENRQSRDVVKRLKKTIVNNSDLISPSTYRMIYGCILTGDPKGRQTRAIINKVFLDQSNDVRKEVGNERKRKVK